MKFETVIIDEATQASEADALISITKGCRKVVMVGDDKQLGVAVHMMLLKASNLELSLFERLLSLNDASILSCTLQTQYRMHPSIWKPLAEVVYGFEAHCTPIDVQSNIALFLFILIIISQLNFLGINFFNSILVLLGTVTYFQRIKGNGKVEKLATLAIDTGSYHEVAADGASSLNVQEAITVSFLVINLLRAGIKADDIGVITFYKGQAAQIRKILQNHSCLSIEDKKVHITSPRKLQKKIE